MKNEFEQIKEEISSTIAMVRAAEKQASEQRAAVQREYETAKQQMAAALESGSLEQYKAAGMAAEEKRLELEFIEKSQAANLKQSATAEDDARIRAGLMKECYRIRTDALAQLKTIFGEAADVAAEALRQFTVVDGIYSSWQQIVMKKAGNHTVAPTDARLTLAQLEQEAKAPLNRFQYFMGV